MAILSAETFITNLLRETPPIHRDDLRQLAALISSSPDLVDTLKKKGLIRAINGFRTIAEKDMKCDRLKSKVVTEAFLGVIEWEKQHSEELSCETIIDLLDKALKKGIIPYTAAHTMRQASYTPNDIDTTDLNMLGVQIDFYDSICKTIYIHLLDDTQDINKCLSRFYLIKSLEARLCASAEVQIYTTNKIEAASRYQKMHRKYIRQLPCEYSYYSFIYGLNIFKGF